MVAQGKSEAGLLMLKRVLIGENPCNVDKLFRKIKQFGFHGRQGGGVSGILRLYSGRRRGSGGGERPRLARAGFRQGVQRGAGRIEAVARRIDRDRPTRKQRSSQCLRAVCANGKICDFS